MTFKETVFKDLREIMSYRQSLVCYSIGRNDAKELQVGLSDWEGIQDRLPKTSHFTMIKYGKPNFLLRGIPVVVNFDLKKDDMRVVV